MSDNPLAALLQTLQEQLQAFRQLLEREQSCLTTWPVVGLQEITHEKQRQAQTLQQLDTQCRRLLTDAGLLRMTPAQRQQSLTAQAIWPQWQQTRELMTRCRNLNEGNGARLQALSQHTLRLLDCMGAGATSPSITYGRAGQYQIGGRRSAIGRA